MARDMSDAQFREALKRNGMTPEGFMGYVDLGIPGQKVSASRLNAGKNRRAQLAYLLKKRNEYMAKLPS